ncbi:MAG: ATP synthase F1 subunit gamma [Desulfobacterales bacterium]
MPSLKDVKIKIGAVKKTQQITKAMNMVATSRLRGAQTNMDRFRPYAAKFSEVLGGLAGKADAEASPLLVPRSIVNNIHIILCTSDRGLCGGFNVSLVEAAEKLIAEKSHPGVSISLTAFGKKGRDWAKKRKIDLKDEYIGVVGTKFGFNLAINAGRKLIDRFLDEYYDEVYIVYAEFFSMGKQIPTIKQLLPIPPIEMVEEESPEAEYLPEHISEPSPGELLDELLPRNIYVQLFSSLLETSTSEHAARMTAMDNATKACKDMLENLTLVYNKARQAAITSELMDIVGGAEALRG